MDAARSALIPRPPLPAVRVGRSCVWLGALAVVTGAMNRGAMSKSVGAMAGSVGAMNCAPTGSSAVGARLIAPAGVRFSLLAAVLLLVSTGCGMLDTVTSGASATTHTVDPSQPFVVVTVGGSPVATPTSSVVETIPESTSLPRIALPTRDPAATPPPVASPSLTRPGASSQAAQPSGNPQAAASPAAAARTP